MSSSSNTPSVSDARPRYPFEIPELGIPQQVAPGVHWLRLPLPFALDHINVWLLEGSDHWILVDTGANTPAVQALWRALTDSGFLNRGIKTIFLTHCHPDHIGMAEPLSKQFGAPVMMTGGEYLSARVLVADLPGVDIAAIDALHRRHGAPADLLQQSLHPARGGIFQRLVPTVPLSFQRVFGNQLVELGPYQWRVHLGYGHSPEHAGLIADDAKLWISGDMLLPSISTNISVYPSEPDGDPLALFIASLESMLQVADDLLVLPSHGAPFYGAHARCRALLAHHHRHLDRIMEVLTTPHSAYDLLPTLFPRRLDGHQLGFAMGEAIAHLNHLWRQGRLNRREDDTGVLRFVAA